MTPYQMLIGAASMLCKNAAGEHVLRTWLPGSWEEGWRVQRFEDETAGFAGLLEARVPDDDI